MSISTMIEATTFHNSNEIHNSSIINDTDVLLGRTGKAFKSLGNQKLRKQIALKLDEYIAAPSRKEKTKVVRDVIHHVFTTGGRFLKLDRDTDTWKEANLRDAKRKVGHAFRDACKPDKVKCMQAMRQRLEKTGEINQQQQQQCQQEQQQQQQQMSFLPCHQQQNECHVLPNEQQHAACSDMDTSSSDDSESSSVSLFDDALLDMSLLEPVPLAASTKTATIPASTQQQPTMMNNYQNNGMNSTFSFGVSNNFPFSTVPMAQMMPCPLERDISSLFANVEPEVNWDTINSNAEPLSEDFADALLAIIGAASPAT